MEKRIPMNSKSLQAAFPEVYRDFFSKCPLVVSAPGSLSWGGGYGCLYGGMTLMQKLPLRVYIGLEPIKQAKIIINNKLLAYDNYNNKFEFNLQDNIITNKLEEILSPYLNKYIKNKNSGLIIHQLSEIPIKRGINSSSAFSTALAAATYIYSENIFSKIYQWQDLPTHELIKDKLFNQIYKLAWKFDSVYHGGAGSGRADFCAMTSTSFPIIFFTEKRKGNYNNHPDDCKPSNLMEHYEVLDSMRYWGSNLKEFFDLKNIYAWPIDFGLIFMGQHNDAGNMVRTIPSFSDKLYKTTQHICGKLEKNIQKNNLIYFPSIHKELLNTKSDNLIDKYAQVLYIVSLEIINTFGDIWKHSASDSNLRDFFHSLNKFQETFKLLDFSCDTTDNICHLIHEKAKKLNINSGVAAKINGGGKGGTLLFAAPLNTFRNEIFDIIIESQNKYNSNIRLDYASWLDGIEEEGIKVEQHLAEGIRSKFISEGTVILRKWKKEEADSSEIGSLDKLEEEKKQIDFLIDLPEEKIYVQGQKLTSKQLHSASATIEILRILLNNLGKNVSNKNLPESSYSQDRNEMQSKIITPLVKVIKEKTGKKLPLSLSGGLTEFYLKLDPSDLDIRIIEKIF